MSLLASVTWGVAEAVAPDLPIEGAVYQVHRPSGTLHTYIDIQVGDDFAGALPDAIDEIRVVGPDGPLPLGKDDFEYNARLRAFWVVLPGSPELGAYRFEVTSGARQGLAGDTQGAVRVIPIPDGQQLRPGAGAIVTCPSPGFSWPRVKGDGPLFYQLQIRDQDRQERYRSRYAKDRLGLRPPPGVFEDGQAYQWRVRVADAPDWSRIENRAQSRWRRFSISDRYKHCAYEPAVPHDRRDGLGVVSLDEAVAAPDRIQAMIRDILMLEFRNVDGVLIAKDGSLLVEEYFNGYGAGDLHALHSVSKSITSLLVGIALDREAIPAVDTPVHRFFPTYRGTSWVDQRYPISVRDLLIMSAGIEWDSWTLPLSDPRNDSTRMLFHSDGWLRYVLDKPMVEEPGARWNYSGGLTLLLGGIIEQASGQPADRYAERYLFGPLGISDYEWHKHADGTVNTAGGLQMRPRDLVKIGQLLLDRGLWNDRRVISERWVAESTANHISTGDRGYGYQWYRGRTLIGMQEHTAFWAWGLGGQVLFVFPALELVAVFTSTPDIGELPYYDEPGLYQPLQMLERYIIPALAGEQPGEEPGEPFTPSPGDLDDYVGEYTFVTGGDAVTLSRIEDALFASGPGEEPIRMYPDAPDLFSAQAAEIGRFRVLASRGADGRVTGATLYRSPFVSRLLRKAESD